MKFLSAIDFVAPITILKVKSKTKSWFDIDVLNANQNRNKHYKNFKQSCKEIDTGNFKCAKLLLKKLINNKKNFTLQKKLQEIGIILRNSSELQSLHVYLLKRGEAI